MATPGLDSAHDVLRYGRRSLRAILEPRVVAVIGATERPGSVGRSVLWNLIREPFGGTVYPVNPARSSVLGIRAYPTIADVPERVDLAVVATPAATVPAIIGQCAQAQVGGAIILSAGFREIGPEGAALERQVLEQARRGGMRLIGPNCLGVMRPVSGLNATFAHAMAKRGSVGFISQSGALCTAVLDWSLRQNVGFSAFISVGSMADVGWGDLIDYLGDDPATKSIVIYMESIGDARSFLSAAREVALTKPIILLKAGRSEQAARAAASHTGAMTGSDEVLSAACRRTGVLRVDGLADLFYMADVLGLQPRPRGPRLAIITNAGGPGVLATDALSRFGGELAELTPPALDQLNRLLPSTWSHANPVDLLGDADPARYRDAVRIVVTDEGNDGLLVILTPQAMTDPLGTAQQVAEAAANLPKPVLASWMGGASVEAGQAVLTQSRIPSLPYPDTATRIFCYMWAYTYNLQGLYETPAAPPALEGQPDQDRAARILRQAHEDGRLWLDEVQSKQLLAAYGIPVVRTEAALSEQEAVEAARRIGFPVAVKLLSWTITHKGRVGGVRLNLADEEAVRAAYRDIEAAVRQQFGPEHFAGVSVQPMLPTASGYELIVGSSVDEQFGPVLLFGSGGALTEVYQDRALALPPLNTTLAQRMMEQTKVYRALRNGHGSGAIDLAALEALLVRFSQLVVELPRIREIDINPLLASPAGLVALDARVGLHGPEVRDEDLPRPAIRPYPTQYIAAWTTRRGQAVTFRPIRPEDEPLLVEFHHALSDRTVHLRYFQSLRLDERISHDRLRRQCFIDYNRAMALVIEHTHSNDPKRQILGVGRLTRIPGTDRAEFAMVIRDDHQGQGLGTELLKRLLDIAKQEGIRRVTADILPDNVQMQRVCEKAGFRLRFDAEERVVKAFWESTGQGR